MPLKEDYKQFSRNTAEESARMLREIFFSEHDKDALLSKISSGRYSGWDIVRLKILTGNDKLLSEGLKKLVPDLTAVEVDGFQPAQIQIVSYTPYSGTVVTPNEALESAEGGADAVAPLSLDSESQAIPRELAEASDAFKEPASLTPKAVGKLSHE